MGGTQKRKEKHVAQATPEHLPGSGPKQKRALSTKLGYSMMAVSVGVFSMSIIQKKLSEAQDEGEERTISTVAIFGMFLLVGLVKSFVWDD